MEKLAKEEGSVIQNHTSRFKVSFQNIFMLWCDLVVAFFWLQLLANYLFKKCVLCFLSIDCSVLLTLSFKGQFYFTCYYLQGNNSVITM